MTINKFRGFLYLAAKLLGDVQSIEQAHKRRSPAPVGKRIGRRIAGKVTGALLGKLFK